MHTPNPRHHSLSAFDQKLPDRRKVGDTLTAIPEGAAAATYQWLADGKEITDADDATLLVTEDLIGTKISVTVTAEDGETASDTVYVGGFSIVKVEPTTAMDNKGTGYKYVKATFSNPLKTLTEADIEIRNVKTDQLYSVEKVVLSSDGYSANITIAGDAAVAGTTFLLPATIYSCTISSDGLDATLEFQLPDVWSDMLVTSVDTDKNTVTVIGTVRSGGQIAARPMKLNVGDSYAGNLGELVGHTVVLGLDADQNISSFRVNDGEVVFGYVTAKDGNDDGDFDSSKDYFETVSGDKYYLSETTTSTTNVTYGISADNSGDCDTIDNKAAVGLSYEYGKLILNTNGTVSAAVLWTAFDGHIIATEADGSVAKETSNNSKDFKGYTVIDGATLNYVDPTDISDGDIIYYSDATPKFAFIYNENVTGTLKTVYEDKLDIDGKKYNFIVWVTNSKDGVIAKQARYYDADADEYKDVTEKWANTLDKTTPVAIYLDTHGDGVLVAGVETETVTHTKDYIITKSPKAYKNGLSDMMDMSVSDGTEVTLHIAAADLTSVNGDAFGDVTLSATNANYVFNIVDNDGKKTKDGKANADESGSDAPVASTVFQQGGLVEVTYNEDESKVVGLKIKLGAQPTAAEITMMADENVELKGGLSSIKTTTNAAVPADAKDGSLTLSGTTKVYVITGTAMKAGELENDTAGPNDTAGKFKEATDNKVKLYNYSDYDLNTKAGDALLPEFKTHDSKTTQVSAVTVGSRVRFVADKTAATAIVIDNRGVNNSKDAAAAKDVVGAALGQADLQGGKVFKDAETTTDILGVAKSANYQLNSDGATEQLAELTVLTVDGEVVLTSFKAKLDTNKDVKDKIVLAKLDSSGKVQELIEGENASTAPAVDVVNFGNKVTTATPSTDTLTVSAADGNYSLKADTDCLVVKFDGTSYTESTIGDINRDTDYVGVKFKTSQLNGKNIKAKVIVAVKEFNPAAYTATLAGFDNALGSVETDLTFDSEPVDQWGLPFTITGTAATQMTDEEGTAVNLKVTVNPDGVLTFAKNSDAAILATGTYFLGYDDTLAGSYVGITATVSTESAAGVALDDSDMGTITIETYTPVLTTAASVPTAAAFTSGVTTLALKDQYGAAFTPSATLTPTVTDTIAAGDETDDTTVSISTTGVVTVTPATATWANGDTAEFEVGDKTVTLVAQDNTPTWKYTVTTTM